MKDNDPLREWSHVWAWPYVVGAIAFSLIAFAVIYGTISYVSDAVE
jgi:hypothetical protein